MKLIKVGAAALNQTPLDWANNQSNIRNAIAIARRDHVSILCFPELCITLQRDLTWDNDDIALQNIQARVRSPGVWLLANLRNALLLSTSNHSEAPVGYATIDGDTSGGLSPVAGIDKTFLIQWLEWMERQGRDGLHSIPALSFVTTQKPTAELRPPEHHQTDEKDLVPYVVLDAIERAAIRDKLSPSEVHDLL